MSSKRITAVPFHAGEMMAAGGTVGVMGLGNEPETAGVIRIGVLDNDPFALDAIDQIAASLGLSVSTVKTHIGNILRKPGQTNRVRLIVWSARHSM